MITNVANLVKDTEIITFQNGNKIGKNVLAINKNIKKKNGEIVTDTTFVPVEFTSNIIEHFENKLKKGQTISFWGELKEAKWETKEGEKRRKLYIRVYRLVLVDKSK